MKELGFDENGNEEVKKAFIKNLIKTANHKEYGAEIHEIKQVKAGQHIHIEKSEPKKAKRMEQLSFLLDDDKKLA